MTCSNWHCEKTIFHTHFLFIFKFVLGTFFLSFLLSLSLLPSLPLQRKVYRSVFVTSAVNRQRHWKDLLEELWQNAWGMSFADGPSASPLTLCELCSRHSHTSSVLSRWERDQRARRGKALQAADCPTSEAAPCNSQPPCFSPAPCPFERRWRNAESSHWRLMSKVDTFTPKSQAGTLKELKYEGLNGGLLFTAPLRPTTDHVPLPPSLRSPTLPAHYPCHTGPRPTWHGLVDLIELDIPACLGIVRWHENLPGSGRTRRKIRETEILRDGGGGVGGALPIEHRQSPMVPRLSAKHGVWRCFEVFNPELWQFGFATDGRGGRCTGALIINSSFISSFCLSSKQSKILFCLPQTGMNVNQMLQMLPCNPPTLPGGWGV